MLMAPGVVPLAVKLSHGAAGEAEAVHAIWAVTLEATVTLAPEALAVEWLATENETDPCERMRSAWRGSTMIV